MCSRMDIENILIVFHSKHGLVLDGSILVELRIILYSVIPPCICIVSALPASVIYIALTSQIVQQISSQLSPKVGSRVLRITANFKKILRSKSASAD